MLQISVDGNFLVMLLPRARSSELAYILCPRLAKHNVVALYVFAPQKGCLIACRLDLT